jgi:transposase
MAAASNLARHKARCSVCRHRRRQAIEDRFTAWESPVAIAKAFRITRDAIYRHAHTFNLLDKRRRNVRLALERIIERCADVEVNAAAVVSAVAAYAKLNSQGQVVERRETLNLNELFSRMSAEEMRGYAEGGQLPGWFTGVVGRDQGRASEASSAILTRNGAAESEAQK